MSLEKHAKTITESKMTAHLEKDMEEIADGRALLPEVVKESQDMLSDVIDVMEKHREVIGNEIRSALMEQSYVGKCPDCEGELRVKRSRKGEFISCSNYPECKRAFPKPRGAKLEPTEEACETCRSPVVRLIRRGSPPQKHCINPDCESNKQATSIGICPECGSTLRLLFSRAGKRFIGCSGYPNCKRTYPLPQFGTLRMTGEVCDACRAPIALVMNQGRPWKFCVNMDCPKREKKAEKKAAKEDKTKPKKESSKPKKETAPKAKAQPRKKAAPAKKPRTPAKPRTTKKPARKAQ